MVRPKKDGKFLNCYVNKEIIERLANYSNETGISKTFIVEKALQKYLDAVMKSETDSDEKK